MENDPKNVQNYELTKCFDTKGRPKSLRLAPLLGDKCS